MRVFLTGGTGRVGTAVVNRLASRGFDITVVGRTPSMELKGARYEQCDIEDYERLHALMHDHEAIVHLAAIPDPIGNPGRALFRANDLGTFNVYEAAAELGIRRVVCASSINALGYFFGDRSFPLPYLPVDEEITGIATDAYSFSKQVMERIGDYFWERDGIRSVFLRLPGVFSHEKALEIRTRWPRTLPIVDEMLSLPDADRESKLANLDRRYDRFRREHRLDKLTRDHGWGRARESAGLLTEDEHRFMTFKANMFASIDELDSAQAVEGGLTAEFEGSHPLYVNSPENSLGQPVAELAKLYSPPVPEIRPQTPGDTCLCSIDRARSLIGFAPEWPV